MPEVASKRKSASATTSEEPKRAGRGRPKAAEKPEKVEKPVAAPAKKAAPADDEPPVKRGRGRPPKDGVKAKPKKLKYPGKGRGRPKATDVPVVQSDDDE